MPQPIAICLGAASEVVTLAPVIHELRRRDAPAVVVLAARPSRMLDEMLATFAVAPGIDLRPAIGGRSPGARIDAANAAIGAALAFARPAAIVVAADTATAFCAAPAAFSRGIPVAQVGAGERSAPASRPFAGDADRRLVAALATWHFTAGLDARANLLAEGIDPGAIEVTGGLAGAAARWIAMRDGLLGRGPGAGARRVLVALRRGDGTNDVGRAAARVVAWLAERADVEIAIAPPRVPGLARDLAAHDNVTMLATTRHDAFVAELAASHLLLADAPAAREAAAALGVPAVDVAGPAAFAEAERLLDDDALAGPRLAAVPASAGGPAARIADRVTADVTAGVTTDLAVPAGDVHSARLAA